MGISFSFFMIFSGTLDPKGQASQGSGDIQVISGSVKNLENILLDISNKLSEEDKAMVERMTGASTCLIDASRAQLHCGQNILK